MSIGVSFDIASREKLKNFSMIKKYQYKNTILLIQPSHEQDELNDRTNENVRSLQDTALFP